MHRGSNHLLLGDFNQRVVLDCIRRSAQGISRVELAQLTGLSAQTISTVTRRLLDDELIQDAGRRITGRGKPRTLLALNPQGRYAVGVHLDPVRTDLTVLDLGGEVVDRQTLWLTPDQQPELTLTQIADSVIELIARDPDRIDKVAGVGVGVPGPLDARHGVMINPPLLPLWRHVRVADELSRRLDMPVLIEKDVIAAAAGESWLTRAQASFLFFYLGAGLGVGLVTDGQAQRGRSHNFGEVGHLVVAEGGPGLACCGKLGTLGARASLTRLSRLAIQAGFVPGDVALQHQDDAITALGQAACGGDRRALQIIDDLAHDLAVGIALLCDLVDVGEVVLGGHTFDACAAPLLARLDHHLNHHARSVVPRQRQVRASRNPTDVVPVGAASLVLDALLSPRATDLISEAEVTGALTPAGRHRDETSGVHDADAGSPVVSGPSDS